MPPLTPFVPRFAAEPPHDPTPSGRWAQQLREEFFAACLAVDAEGIDVGEPGDVIFSPDRTYLGRTYVPCNAATSTGNELFGYVSFIAPDDGDPSDFHATADVTEETAAANPDWQIDLNDDVIGGWRGEGEEIAAITLVWGRPTAGLGEIATAELGEVTVDQCALVEGRFTLIAPDDIAGATLSVTVFGPGAAPLATESLYVDDET